MGRAAAVESPQVLQVLTRDSLSAAATAMAMDGRDMSEDSAATAMAAAQRGNIARKEQKAQSHAATRVAAAQRGKNARKEADNQNKSASAIQARIRGQKNARADGGHDAAALLHDSGSCHA